MVAPDVQEGLEKQGDSQGLPPRRTEQGIIPSALPEHPAVSGECFQEEDGGPVMKGMNAQLGSRAGPNHSPVS